MIDLSTWLLFLAVSLATTFSPGPGVLLAISNAVNLGARGALPGAVGNALGTLIVAGFSVTAIGLLLRTSELAFGLLKVCGATYLAWLGIRQLWNSRAPTDAPHRPAAQATWRQVFGRCLLVAVSNPKSILFFTALFPHFLGSDTGAVRFAILSLTFAGCAVLSHVAYIMLASSIAGGGAAAGSLRYVTGAGGLLMLGMGLSLLTLRLN